MWLALDLIIAGIWGWRRKLSGVTWTILTACVSAGLVTIWGPSFWSHWIVSHPQWGTMLPWPDGRPLLWLVLTPLVQIFAILIGGLNAWRHIQWSPQPLWGLLLGIIWGGALWVFWHFGHPLVLPLPPWITPTPALP